jgi:hypothetical protein
MASTLAGRDAPDAGEDASMTLRVIAAIALVVGLSCGCRDAIAQAPAQAACARMTALCQGSDADRQECERTFAELHPAVDAENVARSARCMAEARTCGEATGCMAGAAARAGANFLRDFTNGFTR